MYAIAISGLAAFCACVVLTPVVRNVFLRARILDHPDSDRKLHCIATPRVGGIAILLSYAVALGVALVLPLRGNVPFGRGLLLSFAPATLVIFLTGLLDDLVTLRPRHKLLGQSLAAALAVSLGARADLHAGPVWLSLAVSYIWLLACSNAFNLIDGMDGLAGGVGLFASGSVVVIAIYFGDRPLALAAMPLAACLVAFLRSNFPPATIFLGDCGSLTIGFLLGCFTLSWTHHTSFGIGILAPVVALALPLTDVVLSIGRRCLRGVSIFTGDTGHIHHMVRSRTGTRRGAALTLYAACAITSFFAILLSVSAERYLGIIAFVFSVIASASVAGLGYSEFRATRRYLLQRFSLRAIRHEISLLEIERALDEADTPEDFWRISLDAAECFGFVTFRMVLHGCEFAHSRTPSCNSFDPTWKFSLPLGNTGEVIVTGLSSAEPSHRTFAFLRALRLAADRKDRSSTWVFEADAEPALSYSGAA